MLSATDLSAISGVVFKDIAGNGLDAGEEVAGAEVRLYLDRDADGVRGGGDGGPLSTLRTGPDGGYRFDDLDAGRYLVEVPAQIAGGVSLRGGVSQVIVITPADAAGTPGLPIDTFDSTSQFVTAFGASQRSDHSAQSAVEALGGQRDLYVELTSGAGRLEILANVTTIGQLDFGSLGSATGVRRVSWDGVDASGQTVNTTGLGGVDLTEGGHNTGIDLNIGSDLGGTASLKVYTNSGEWSEAVFNIAANGGGPTDSLILDFADDFQARAGGGVRWDSVGAIVFEIDGIGNIDASVNSIGTIGPTVFEQDFANFEQIDLSLIKTVSSSEPGLGSQTQFNITVLNAGPDDATGVEVTDLLPAGLSLVNSSATTGAYNESTGLWTIGTVAAGSDETLTLTALVNATGKIINVAEVTAHDQADIDSIPGNGVADEDDQDMAMLTPQAIDISLEKTVDNATPNYGQEVTFSIVVRNDGPSDATGVQVLDKLPSGLELVRSETTAGLLNESTGVWSVGALLVGQSESMELVARVVSHDLQINVAEVIAHDQRDIDSEPNNHVPAEDDQDLAEVIPREEIDLVLEKSDSPDSVDQGAELVYTIDVRNDGPSPATGVVVTDNLPDEVTFVSASTSQGGFSQSGGVVTVNLGNLDVGASASIIITVRVNEGVEGDIFNEAEVRGNENEVLLSNNRDEEITTVNIEPASIAGTVFFDQNGNGVRDLGTGGLLEPGIAGVEIMLQGQTDAGAAVMRTVFTDSAGDYEFANLLPGVYEVIEKQPDTYSDGVDILGGDPLALQTYGVNDENDVFSQINLVGGRDLDDYDFAELRVGGFSKRLFLASAHRQGTQTAALIAQLRAQNGQ